MQNKKWTSVCQEYGPVLLCLPSPRAPWPSFSLTWLCSCHPGVSCNYPHYPMYLSPSLLSVFVGSTSSYMHVICRSKCGLPCVQGSLIHISVVPSDTVCDTVHIENCIFWLVTLNGKTGKCIANADNIKNTKYCLILYVSLANVSQLLLKCDK